MKYENSPKKEAWPLRGEVEKAIAEAKNLPLVQHREVDPVLLTTLMTQRF